MTMSWKLPTILSFVIIIEPTVTEKLRGIEMIPRRALFGYEERTGVLLSPDGLWLVWIVNRPGKTPTLHITGLQDKTSKTIAFHDYNDVNLRIVAFAYDNRSLVYSKDYNGNENWHLSVVDVISGRHRNLTSGINNTSMFMDMSPLHPDHIIIGINDRDIRYFDVHKIYLGSQNETPATEYIFQNDGYNEFKFDSHLNIRILGRENDDGSRLLKVAKVDNKTGVLNVSNFMFVDFDNVDYVYLDRIDITNRYLYICDNDGGRNDFSSLYRIDFLTWKKELIYKPDEGFSILSTYFHPLTRTPVWLVISRLRRKIIVLDEAYRSHVSYLEEKFSRLDCEIHIDSWNSAFNLWLVRLTTDISPPAYYLFNLTDNSLRFLFSSLRSVSHYQTSKQYPINIPVQDNLTQVCYLSLPVETDAFRKGRPTSPIPTILKIHGGPWARDYWGFDKRVQWMTNRGYAVLQCNYRGSIGFGKKFGNAGYSQWGLKMQNDLAAAAAWLVNQNISRRNSIAIWGHSYGGYATLTGLALTPDLYACGIDIVGPSNLVTLLKSIPPYWKSIHRTMVRKIGGDPNTKEGQKFLKSRSPLFHASNIRRPLLIAQGSNDPRVHQFESDRIVEVLRKLNRTVTYMLFHDEGHGFTKLWNKLAFYAEAERFLGLCLGGRVEPINEKEFRLANLTVLRN